MPFDPIAFKANFPLFQQAENQRLVYLDNAATTQKPQAVIDAISHFYCHSNANAHRSSHRLARQATTLLEQTRQKTADFLGANSHKEIVFTSGATAALNLLAFSLCQNLQAGDEILLTVAEHHANLVPWQIQAQQKQLKLRFLPLNFSQQDLEQALTEQTKIISLCAASNALGFLHDLELLRPLHTSGKVKIVLDGSQIIAHRAIQLKHLPCDFFVASAHKMYGPTGLGILYGKKALLEQLSPWQTGGEMIKSVSLQAATFAETPQRFEAGTSNLAAIAGFSACLDFCNTQDRQAMQQFEQQLCAELHQALASIAQITLLSQADHNVGIATFAPNQQTELHAADVATLLDEQDIAVRCGLLCTEPLWQQLQQTSVIRVSLAAYNTSADIQRLCQALREIFSEQQKTENPTIERLFNCKDSQQRYKQLMQLGAQHVCANPIREERYLIKGCESALWLSVSKNAQQQFTIDIDSDSRLLKGLAVLLLHYLDGKEADSILAFDLSALLQRLNLQRYLTESRQNGLFELVTAIKKIVAAHNEANSL